ncbi:MAG: DNA starvation/stationary phase protection protein [Alphaproteobacteria bacterium]|nr:DNA starvation/stationary phase protection protein [Alphaproteobacteria bacterium]
MKLVKPKTDSRNVQAWTNEKQRRAVADALGVMLASTYSLYVKSLFYHWNVTGPNFHSLHALFEEHYQDLHAAGDDLAERIRALGFFTPGTLKAFSDMSVIRDDDKLPDNSNGMLESLRAAHDICSREARNTLEVAEKVGDEVTIDMMVERMRFHDEAAWMLSASLA